MAILLFTAIGIELTAILVLGIINKDDNNIDMSYLEDC